MKFWEEERHGKVLKAIGKGHPYVESKLFGLDCNNLCANICIFIHKSWGISY